MIYGEVIINMVLQLLVPCRDLALGLPSQLKNKIFTCLLVFKAKIQKPEYIS